MNNNSTEVKTGLKPLFPTLDSLDAAVELGMSQLPIKTPNALLAILNTYHNTLVTQINKETTQRK